MLLFHRIMRVAPDRKKLHFAFSKAGIFLLVFFSCCIAVTPNLYAGQDCWTTKGGRWNLVELGLNGKGLKVDEYVPANSTVKLYPTNNGNRIKNKDGTIPYLEYTNTKDKGFTEEYIWGFQKINGLQVTDVDQETTFQPTGVLQAAAFAGSAMLPLADWLYSVGYYSGSKLPVPDFNKVTDTLFFAVPLNAWIEKGVSISPGDVGSTYDVLNGRVTNRASGSGPTADELEDVYFSNVRCSPDGNGDWTSPEPYNGEVTLFGFHEFEAFDIKENPTLSEWGLIVLALLLLLTAAVWLLRRRRRRMAAA